MASLPKNQESQVNASGLTGEVNSRLNARRNTTGELFNKKIHYFWEEILEKPVDSHVGTQLADSESVAELNGSTGRVQPVRHVSPHPSGHENTEALAPAVDSTNSAQPLDLFQVGLELLQERLRFK